MELYSEPNFQGELVDVEDGTAALAEDFTPRSCKVFSGRYRLLQHSLVLMFLLIRNIQVLLGINIEVFAV